MKNTAPLFRELTFGFEDSLVSTLGAVTGIAAGTADNPTVLLAGIVYVAVETLAMVAGSFLSSKTETEVERHELDLEKISLKDPSTRARETEDFLSTLKLKDTDKQKLIQIVTENPEYLVEEIASHKLGIGSVSSEKPILNAAVMGVSYTIGGLVPIFPYALLPLQLALPTSIVFTLIAISLLGVMKAKFGGTPVLKNIIEVVGISAAVAIIGYTVGQVTGTLFNLKVR